MTLRDSQKVTYAGAPTLGLAQGDSGVVLSVSGDAAHVMWATGAKADQVDLVPQDDLVPLGRQAVAASPAGAFDDSLTYGTMVTVAVRDTFDAEGESGLLSALAAEGHLATLSSVAEEALVLVMARVREDEAIRQTLAHLDAEEGERLVSMAAAVVLREAFGE